MGISLNHVSFTYQNETIISDLSLDVQQGDCIVLCGASGCGKTTITRIINGLINELYEGTLEGERYLNDTSYNDLSFYQLPERIGSVFQNPKTQFFTLEVLSELAFPCENIGMSPDKIQSRIEDVATLFNIHDLLNREMFSLSGGEKQLVALASAYMLHPEYLVLDEPSSNLDLQTIERLTDILHRLKNVGCTLIISEHRLYYLESLADYYLYQTPTRDWTLYDKPSWENLTSDERQTLGLRTKQLPEKITLSPSIIACNDDVETLRIKQIPVRWHAKSQPLLTTQTHEFKAGTIIGIIGPNGVGKSTFSKQLAGILPCDADKISWNGNFLSDKERLRQSYLVMQDVNYQLFTETVERELTLKATRLELRDEIIQSLNLGHLLKRHPMTLSGGEKQRVAIASALLSGKKVVILDEPTSGMDYQHMIQLKNALNLMKKHNLFIFIITHDIEFIEQTMNELLVLTKQGSFSSNSVIDRQTLEMWMKK
ncbi:ABC transporter ATP-binding protein [Vagococcus lutrae]|uniref:ABC transporter ATP-binding protein n=1 Tax=Vagococcus lutrae TaxID=81947 RepID=UPI00200CB202|nr:ABC transporter ATP-binding protein [Vagococcus lutrae]MDT2823189.1 ABC transporter ATP-binding protein [Vagococcus lutrae]MDT2841668.1 ABC transporter ATP-binding protein [Vagococcus lutrae]UQF19059.1 ABC transporter ATP-binding protein [Vagococcus lutrae]